MEVLVISNQILGITVYPRTALEEHWDLKKNNM